MCIRDRSKDSECDLLVPTVLYYRANTTEAQRQITLQKFKNATLSHVIKCLEFFESFLEISVPSFYRSLVVLVLKWIYLAARCATLCHRVNGGEGGALMTSRTSLLRIGKGRRRECVVNCWRSVKTSRGMGWDGLIQNTCNLLSSDRG